MSNRKFYVLLAVLMVLVFALAGCGITTTTSDPGDSADGADTPAETTDNAGLAISGLVDSEQSWTEEEVRAMETMESVYTNNDGEETTYTGVAINALLDEAGVQDDAAEVVFVADDGYEGTVTLEELSACDACIVAFRDEGGFSTVLPDFPGNVQVKGVVEIKLQ